jgi:hypothetical protein
MLDGLEDASTEMNEAKVYLHIFDKDSLSFHEVLRIFFDQKDQD